MQSASPMTFLGLRSFKHKKIENKIQQDLQQELSSGSQDNRDLNVTIVTFDKLKQAEKNLAGGDPYECKNCKAILNKFSIVRSAADLQHSEQIPKVELKKHQSCWQCQFCSYMNVLAIEKEEIPQKEDLVYMLEHVIEEKGTELQSTVVFCIDVSGSMNSTSEVSGKMDLKYGLSQEEIDMLKQFMQPGDEAQFNYLPGNQNHNKTFISRKQCILSAVQTQLSEIRKSDPHKKIGFVTFNNEVTAIGDSKTATVNILGDKLNHQQSIIEALENFHLTDSITEAHQNLINTLNKTEAKGQTALGPALVASLTIASKGSPGSSVLLCTDGLANIGIGQLEPSAEISRQFYQNLGEQAQARKITVNVMTIKGEGCKMEVIGKLAELTNGNMKVVNPQKLSEDFANVLKDQVVGLNVNVRIMLHKAMQFRNEEQSSMKQNKRLLEKYFANATKNTRISFEYQLRCLQQLQTANVNIAKLRKVPFQAQIVYMSPKSGKFLRVISAQSDTTTEKQQIKKQANLAVVHQRITSQTAALYAQGDYKSSSKFNSKWGKFLSKNFNQQKYQQQQSKFAQKNERLNKAIRHKHKKSIEKKQQMNESISQQEMEIALNHSAIDSDEDQMQLMDNLRERQNYSINKSFPNNIRSASKSKKSRRKSRSKSPQSSSRSNSKSKKILSRKASKGKRSQSRSKRSVSRQKIEKEAEVKQKVTEEKRVRRRSIEAKGQNRSNRFLGELDDD